MIEVVKKLEQEDSPRHESLIDHPKNATHSEVQRGCLHDRGVETLCVIQCGPLPLHPRTPFKKS